ncbi:ComF family protein [Clostridium perfringens]|nr:ComF family protein [Clostridium perfringens]
MEICKNKVNYFFQCLLEAIYPTEEKCYICNKEGKKIICDKCRGEIPKVKDILIIEECTMMVCSYYSFIVKDLILRLKYKGDFHAGEILVLLLEEKVREENLKIDFITYVPVAKDSLKKKEFNQCEYLSKELAKKLDVKAIETLKKKNKIKEQKSLSREEREKNVKDAFKLKNYKGLEGKNILLLDDVMTTGATLKSCIRELKKIKDIKIFLLTIAKSNI